MWSAGLGKPDERVLDLRAIASRANLNASPLAPNIALRLVPGGVDLETLGFDEGSSLFRHNRIDRSSNCADVDPVDT